jgi:invasion protein IalB
MKKAILAAVLGSAMLCGGAAMADETQTMQASPAVATDNGSQVVCKAMIHEGDIMKKQVCMTNRQWNLIKIQNRQYLRDVQLHGDLQIAH